MQPSFDTSFESRLAKMDLTAVMAHVVADHGLSTADAARAEDLYRKFLTLVHENPGQSLVPPRLVDLVWHAHITFTRQYMADCDMLFGRYVHHEMLAEDNPMLVDSVGVTKGIFDAQYGAAVFAGLSAEHQHMACCVAI